jgi:acetyltransferase-like isoleucine patch superfamily enzyme
MTATNLQGRSGIIGPLRKIVRYIVRRVAVNENTTYGANFRVGRGSVISSPHGLVIGDSVSVGPRSIIQVDGTIGDFTLIGMAVQIVGRDDHAVGEVGVPIVLSTWAGDRPQGSRDSVTIGRDVWIGGGAIVLSGITIGEGSVIGSGSVVTRDIPPYSIAAGNPARVIKNRFDSSEIELLHAEGLDALASRGRGKRSS